MPANINNSPTIRAIAVSLLSCTLSGTLSHEFKGVAYDTGKHQKTHSEQPHDPDHSHDKRRRKFLKDKHNP